MLHFLTIESLINKRLDTYPLQKITMGMWWVWWVCFVKLKMNQIVTIIFSYTYPLSTHSYPPKENQWVCKDPLFIRISGQHTHIPTIPTSFYVYIHFSKKMNRIKCQN